MASKGQVEVNIPRLFSQLQLAGEDGDYDWGLELVDKILKIAPDDQDALMCKVICLIQVTEYKDALKLIERLSKQSGKQVCLYEKAYCQYKQEKYEMSLRTLEKLTEEEKSSTRVLDLIAQIYYRCEKYQLSAETFQKGRSNEDSQERAANMAAALSYCDSTTVNSILLQSPVAQDTMEQCFNLATTYLNSNANEESLNKAQVLLEKSEELCKAALAESDEDNEQELIPIRIQQAYTLQCRGQLDKAMSLYATVLKQKPSNSVHVITAANNIIVLNRDKDVFDSKKKVKLVANEAGLKKLNSQQQAVVLFNRCLFALQMNQLEQCRQLLIELKSLSPNCEITILVESALINREKKVSESSALLEQHMKSNPSSVLLHLTLAQIYLSQGNLTKVREVLEKVPDLVQYLGIVSVLISLYTAMGDVDNSMTLLDSVFRWWKTRKDVSNSVKEKVFWVIAQYKLQHSRPQEAADVFEHLYRQDKKNTRYLANLISAYSRFDPKKAEELGHQLSQFNSLSMTIDIDALEQMPSFKHTRRQVTKAEMGKKQDVGPQTSEVQKKKKKRKPKLPKNYDPSKPPDPERWLPLRERSYYRKAKKKGQSNVGRGTQGLSAASISLSAKLDASKPKATPTEDVTKREEVGSTRVKNPPQKPQQQRKKKKGKR